MSHPLLTGDLKYGVVSAAATLIVCVLGSIATAAFMFFTTSQSEALFATILLLEVAVFILLGLVSGVFVVYLVVAAIGNRLSKPVVYALLGALLTLSVLFILSLGLCFGVLIFGSAFMARF